MAFLLFGLTECGGTIASPPLRGKTNPAPEVLGRTIGESYFFFLRPGMCRAFRRRLDAVRSSFFRMAEFLSSFELR
jgi:hypothetical protein